MSILAHELREPLASILFAVESHPVYCLTFSSYSVRAGEIGAVMAAWESVSPSYSYWWICMAGASQFIVTEPEPAPHSW